MWMPTDCESFYYIPLEICENRRAKRAEENLWGVGPYYMKIKYKSAREARQEFLGVCFCKIWEFHKNHHCSVSIKKNFEQADLQAVSIKKNFAALELNMEFFF